MPSGRSAQLFYNGRAPVWRVMTRITWMIYVAYSGINSAVPNLAEESISELQFVVKRWKPYLQVCVNFVRPAPDQYMSCQWVVLLIVSSLPLFQMYIHYPTITLFCIRWHWALIVHKNLRWLRVGQSRLCNHEEEELFLQHFATGIDQGHFRIASAAGSVDHDLFKKLDSVEMGCQWCLVKPLNCGPSCLQVVIIRLPFHDHDNNMTSLVYYYMSKESKHRFPAVGSCVIK